MPKYDVLVDGERKVRVDSESGVREWLVRYREEHVEDDPSAAHVQILRRGPFSWLMGGRLEPRERFLS
jgi:hypothetical protein